MTREDQKNTKPKIEDIIPECMDADARDTALKFVAYLRANKMQPTWSAFNSWVVMHKGKKICTIRIRDPHDQPPFKQWVVVPHISRWNKLVDTYDIFEEQIAADDSRDIVWDNVNVCRRCASCGPGWDMTILGRTFANVCHNVPVWYCDPDDAELDFIKTILSLMKQTIAGKQ